MKFLTPTLSAAPPPDEPTELLHEVTNSYRATAAGQAVTIHRYLTDPHLIARGAAGHRENPSSPALDLPTARSLGASLTGAIEGRHSVRQFAPGMTACDLSTVLYHAIASKRIGRTPLAPDVSLRFRPYPSAGALNGVEFYVLVLNVEGLPSCVAHYSSTTGRLCTVRQCKPDLFATACIDSPAPHDQAGAVIAVTLVPGRLTAKYGPRGYRLAMLEAGHACQNLSLVAHAAGLGSLVYASYFDDELSTVLGLDIPNEVVASVVLLGRQEEVACPSM